MTSERWQKIRRVLEAAVELSPGQREAFLNTAAKEDPDLRVEVDSLLARDRSDSFLRDPAVQASDILRFLQEGTVASKAKLQPGARLGNYAVLSSLGSGGMGEVYKAKDLRLGREVAIKVLPQAFSADQERLARFEREAKLLAALSHANVATLYELNESDGLPLLVMELVEGETLEERIARGPLAIDEAIPLFVEIAAGLEAAHEKGIIHRDLKPANIKIQPSGKPKILDFGLAKVLAEDPSPFDPAESPTVTKGTALGVILGTAHYMSPEQARGGAVDHRTDIWAFGCCLFEALTGKKAFEGTTVTDILAAILTKAPDLDGLPKTTPARIRELIGKCLHKQPGHRLRDVGDAKFDLDAATSGKTVDEAPRAPERNKAWNLKLGSLTFLAGAMVAALGAYALLREEIGKRDDRVIRFSVDTSAEGGVDISWGPAVAVAPDGSRLVFSAKTDLYQRSLQAIDSTLIPAADGGYNIFFSGDSRWLGFVSANDKLARLSMDTGTVEEIMPLSGLGRGVIATWSDADTLIVTSPPTSGLRRVTVGGASEPITQLTEAGMVHLDPELLPGDEAVLFSRSTWETPEDTSVAVRSLTTGEERILVTGGSTPKYSPTGHLIYASGGALYAAPFDLDRLELQGPSALVVKNVATTPFLGTAQYSFSRDGVLAYVPAAAAEEGANWVSRSGAATPVPELRGHHPTQVSLSPDGQQMAMRIGKDIWVLDGRSGAVRRLTFEGSNVFPVWTPDGRRIAFTSTVGDQYNLYWVPADGTARAERLTRSPNAQRAVSWSPDGRVLAFVEVNPDSTHNVWTLTLQDEPAVQPLLNSPYTQSTPMISPDGRWLAYVSDESGRAEVYVQTFPIPGGKWQVSTAGGYNPRWSSDGRELFYLRGTRLMAAPVATLPSFQVGPEKELFYAGMYDTRYDVAPDGRFLMVRTSDPADYLRIHVVVNWFEELKRLVPTGE